MFVFYLETGNIQLSLFLSAAVNILKLTLTSKDFTELALQTILGISEGEGKPSQTALIDIVNTSSYQEYIFLLP